MSRKDVSIGNTPKKQLTISVDVLAERNPTRPMRGAVLMKLGSLVFVTRPKTASDSLKPRPAILRESITPDHGEVADVDSLELKLGTLPHEPTQQLNQ